MKKSISRRSKPRRGAVVLLFSGGRDSTLAAALLACQGYRLHLLTFDNGALINDELTDLRYREFEARFPGAVVSRQKMPSFGLFKNIALVTLEDDVRRFHTNLICMGCKMAMHTLSLIYCLENRIRLIADGYTGYQKDWVEQMPAAIRRFHQEYGVRYINPVYDFTSKEHVKSKLFDLGLSPKPLEGACLFGGTFSVPNSRAVCAYIRRKLPLCRRYIEEWFADRGRRPAPRRKHG